MPRTKTERDYEWFVEDNQASLNDTMARGLDESLGAEMNFAPELICGDDQKRNFWQCSRRTADFLWNSRDSLHIKNLRIFCRAINKDGSRGPLRDVTAVLFAKKLPRKKPRVKKPR